jgi:prepilin-type N-terminal cleavage/methylation domain-containing protein
MAKWNGPGDAGFTLIEVLTSLAVIGVVLTAVTTFFVRSMVSVDAQGARQAAIQLAADGMERLRGVPGPLAYDWLVSHRTETVRANTVAYVRTWDAPTAARLMTATVRVRWTGKSCPDDACSYSTSTLISTAAAEPLFDPAAA